MHAEQLSTDQLRAIEEIERLRAERDKLIQAVADHVTVRAEQYQQIQELQAELATAAVLLGRTCGELLPANERSHRREGEIMSKQDILDLLKLLSALESWSFSVSEKAIPDYLHDRLTESVDLLTRQLIGVEE